MYISGSIPVVLGVDIMDKGNIPELAKHEAFREIARPHISSDLKMLIGMFVFYAPWVPFCEVRVLPFCGLL